jgi:hypothetical protein
MDRETSSTLVIGGVIVLIVGGFLTGVIALGMWGLPKYRLYRQDTLGQANLRQQEWEKQILIEEAKAKKESATLEAEAEIERAKGVAQANQIIGDSLENNDEYLRYLWVQALQDPTNSVIYVPTEANLPILEAGNR